MHTEATSSQLSQTLVFAAFAAYINQRPGLEFADYGDARAFRNDSAQIGRDKKRALASLYSAELLPWDAVAMKAAFGAFSGRLTPVIREDGKLALDYCEGQYWPTEYRKAVAAVLEIYVESVRPKRKPQPSDAFDTIADLAAANTAAGFHWFSRGNKKFARSRVFPALYKGDRLIWFVSSEKSGWEDNSPRKFSVRVFDPADASVNTAGEFNDFSTPEDARDHAKATAKAERDGKHVKPAELGQKCGFCGHYGQGCSGKESAAAKA
ncbi:MAG: hypothetical protein WCA89_08855 [Terracidiphilus sp.]